MSATIYLEGGGDHDKLLQSSCREGFSKLLMNCGFGGRMPKLVACGGRGNTFRDFKTAHKCAKPGDYVAMLVDSEDPVADVEKVWEHLAARPGDRWNRPQEAESEQVLLMTTCMETWIVADRAALKTHYGAKLQESALPPVVDLEGRGRHAVQEALEKATRNCSNAYAKGRRSFAVLAALDPDALRGRLPSFVRVLETLENRLKQP